MNREQYAAMLKDISEIHKAGGDTAACIAKYNERYKFMYIYNDNVFKILFGSPENEKITIDFLNAVLGFIGSDCINNLAYINPALPDAFGKSITSDIVATDQRLDRIVLEVQHIEDDSYNARLVLYTAKHTIASRIKGEDYALQNLNLISLQMFDGFPNSPNYRHSIRFKNQENEEFYDKQTITLVEIPKFLKGNFATDNSRIAQWLRVIDGLNNETPVAVPEGSPFALLQEKAQLSIFTEEFLVSEAMKMSDHKYELYVEKKHARKEGLEEGRAEGRAEGLTEGADAKAREMAAAMLADGDSVEKVVRISKLPESDVLAIKARLQK
jgi:predicted transposase/invertase (TIGR01784 family)